MWKTFRWTPLALAVLAVATVWMLPVADAEAPRSDPATTAVTHPDETMQQPPATFDLEELLRSPVVNCEGVPNPICDPNTDPNCQCDPECDPEVDPECVICEDRCNGPMVDPIG